MKEKKNPETLTFFNEALEYFDKYTEHDVLVNNQVLRNRHSANYLRDEMLSELNNLKNIIENNPDLKIEALSETEKRTFQKFIKFYLNCPVCGNFNHYFNLKHLFFDDKKKALIKDLIKFMSLKNKKFKRYNLNVGIPCCDCYKKLQ